MDASGGAVLEGPTFASPLKSGGAVNNWLAGLGLRCGGSWRRFPCARPDVLDWPAAEVRAGSSVLFRDAADASGEAGRYCGATGSAAVGDGGVSSFLFLGGVAVIGGLWG